MLGIGLSLRHTRGGVAFSPRSLFAGGEEGVWLDTSDISTLFQDSVGTTPVTASGQTVGFGLDKSQGAGYSGGSFTGLGPELVTNGTFDTDSDWTKEAGWTISGGAAVCDGSSNNIYQNCGLVSGQQYVVTFTVSAYTSGSVRFNSGSVNGTSRSATGTFTETITATNSINVVLDATSFLGSVDNISVREVAGNHATQPTVAARPSYIVDADGAFIQHDPVDDALTVTLPDLGTEATVAYVTRSEVRLLEDQTISGSYTLPAQELANFVVIDRALTFAEKVSLIRFLTSKVEGVTYGAEIDRLTLIAVNAVDVFVYDTSKDSDGGAWATDYPAQMVIVAEATAVKIYDATDPGLPLHTTLDFTGYTVTALTAVSGVLAVATTTGLATFNLADGDTTVALDYTTSTTPAIVNNACNDCAMTVLPDAPTDPATGLPVPTIAVATDGGVSVIKDDGTVADSSETAGMAFVAFNDSNRLFYNDDASDQVYYADTYAANGFSDGHYDTDAAPYTLPGNVTDLTLNAIGQADGLTILAEDTTTKANGMVSYVTSSSQTGYMPGDIKGAFLSDTDDTDLVGSGELVTNGTFDTDTSGWTVASTGTLTWSSGAAILEQISGTNALIYQSFATVVGKRYKVSVSVSGVACRILMGTSAFQGNVGVSGFSTGTLTLDFVATTTTTYLGVQSAATVAGLQSTLDNISVKLADADRSVNANGLVIEGSITRTSVASGADLVAYSGFSSSNYLEQPYNADLDFGTGDFCVMGWFNLPAGGSQYQIIDRKAASGPAWQVKVENTAQKLYFSITDDFYTTRDEVLSSSAVDTDTWTFGCCVRSGSTIYVYVNGALAGSTAITNATGSLSNTSATMLVGIVSGGAIPFSGSLALWRISATAPTADQIAKIYNDEKVLFQDNVQATLYGSSDAVTALAFDEDTEILMAGTSAGRSDFQGLRRVGNTTTSVSTAISASGGLIVQK